MKNFIAIIAVILMLSSCKKERLTANGNTITELRTLGVFTGVRASGANAIHIKYGDAYNVELKGSSNLVPYFKTEVVNQKLYLSYENVNISHDDIEVFVTLPALKSIALSGSGKIAIGGNFPLIAFLDLNISGSGDILLNNALDANEVELTISGSGNIELDKLNSKRADVSISGSGDAHIKVQDQLTARISGSGKIYYLGSPTIDSHISGSGKLIKL